MLVGVIFSAYLILCRAGVTLILIQYVINTVQLHKAATSEKWSFANLKKKIIGML